jgi:molecular chaperone DnaK (HSP70)
MHWKQYRNLPAEQKRDESYYVIGLDIGNDSSGIAYYNIAENTPETIDLSGGYGRPSIPTVMQYIAETREWVYGEYAILNRGVGTEVTLNDLIQRLGSFDYIDIGHRPVSIVSILALFLKEILSSVRNINPKAEIVGIVAAVPAYFSEQAQAELTRAFKAAGYERELIALVSDRECVFAHHYQRHTPREERALLFDYGSREVRGGLYHVMPQGERIAVKSISSLFDDTIGTVSVVSDVCDLFESFLMAQQSVKALSKQMTEQVSAFVYQHKDMLFQKAIRTKPAKLYFNFAYPPFQQTLSHADATRLIKPYTQRFNRFMRDVLEKNLYEEEIRPQDISAVLCVGGGFEMLWAREAVGDMFSQAQVRFHKNAKLITAEGAALVAAQRLGMAEGPAVSLEDRHQLTVDIGLSDGDNFLPLVERNAFWWQKHPDKLVLVNKAVGDPEDWVKNSLEPLRLRLAQRTASGEAHYLADLELVGLPERPKGTTRLGLGLAFSSNMDLTVKVRDLGFGEMFPQTEYEREFAVRLE